MMRRFYSVTFVFLVCVVGVMIPVAGQDAVSADDVNAIAKKLYCPVCENIPLDTCGTAACDDWRNEIRIMLENGVSEDAIIDDFIVRFGDRVVGTPKDPTLRNLSLLTPWIVVILMLVGMAFTLLQWQRNKDKVIVASGSPSSEGHSDDKDYMSILERDVLE